MAFTAPLLQTPQGEREPEFESASTGLSGIASVLLREDSRYEG